MKMKKNRKRKKLIKIGRNYIKTALSSRIGAGVGSLLAGPVGAIGGSIVGALVQDICNQIYNNLEERERKRLGALTYFIMELADKKMSEGSKIRSDIDTKKVNNKKIIEEILESIYFKTKNEYEEKKIYYLACFFNYLIFNEDIGIEEAHLLINLFKQLTFRQICILSIISNRHFMDSQEFKPKQWTIRQDYLELWNRQLIIYSDNKDFFHENFIYHKIKLTESGKKFIKYFNIDSIPMDDIMAVSNYLASWT